jgi:FkbM family methyltransferase
MLRFLEALEDRLGRWLTRRRRTTYCFLGDRGLTITRRGHRMYVDLADRGMTPHLALSGEWEPGMERLLARLLRPGDTVVEVGANMGYHTLGMARAVGPSGHVHAFEVHPRILPLLADNLALNGYAGRVTIHARAAMDADGPVAFAADPRECGSGHVEILAHASYSERFEVQGVRINQALAELPRAELLRIDAEGSEPRVLRGAEALLRRSPRLAIMMEWSPAMMRVHEKPEELLAWLGSLGFAHLHRILPRQRGRLAATDAIALAGLAHGDLVLTRAPLPAALMA